MREVGEVRVANLLRDAFTAVLLVGCGPQVVEEDDCLLSLTCDELAERTEKGIAGEDVSGLACWDEAVKSSVCS